jgi:hypothetical protein
METVWTVHMKTMQSAWGKCRQYGNNMDIKEKIWTALVKTI